MQRDIFAILAQALSARKNYIAIFVLIGLLLTCMYLGIYPSIAQKGDEFNKLLESYPESMTAFFGLDELNFSRLENFLAIENFSLTWPLLAILMLMGIAGPAIAGEIEKGTIELILSRPVSRLGLFFGRYLAGVLALLLLLASSLLSVIPLAGVFGVKYAAANYMTASLAGLLFGLAVLSLGMLFSAWFSEKSRVYFAAGGTLGIMYILSAAANLTDKADALKYLSFFYYFDGIQVLMKNTINFQSIAVLAIFIILSTALAAYHFNRRDIAV